MGYLALYRKYRPTKFSEVVGQNVVVEVLKNSIKNFDECCISRSVPSVSGPAGPAGSQF